MRAVLYCRVSTADQVQNLSLPTQEEACRAYCVQHGYLVQRVFVDAGESAKTTNRPAFLDLLRYCREQRGRVHAVVVYALTRFSRNTADHHAIAALLRGLGVPSARIWRLRCALVEADGCRQNLLAQGQVDEP